MPIQSTTLPLHVHSYRWIFAYRRRNASVDVSPLNLAMNVHTEDGAVLITIIRPGDPAQAGQD